MKNANISRLGGFTLIELLVVVLIIGILAAMAMPQYFKAVERSRMAEAVTLMNSITQAQRRKFMQIGTYATRFEGLDVSPKGATGNTYYTKGDPQTGAGGNGFRMFLEVEGWRYDHFYNYIEARRHPDGQYRYTLVRPFHSDNITCSGDNQAGEELCADFCGIDTPVGMCCSDGTAAICPDHHP